MMDWICQVQKWQGYLVKWATGLQRLHLPLKAMKACQHGEHNKEMPYQFQANNSSSNNKHSFWDFFQRKSTSWWNNCFFINLNNKHSKKTWPSIIIKNSNSQRILFKLISFCMGQSRARSIFNNFKNRFQFHNRYVKH